MKERPIAYPIAYAAIGIKYHGILSFAIKGYYN